MKTDPISAAVTYRQYLQEISKAQTLHQARQAAARALQVEFHRPEPGQVSILSGFGLNSQQPFVSFAMANPQEVANPTVQIDVDTARRIAMEILEACDAAESDGFVITWLRETVELTDGAAAQLLQEFRAWRDKRRGAS